MTSVVDEVANLGLENSYSVELQELEKQFNESTDAASRTNLSLEILRVLLAADKYGLVLSKHKQYTSEGKSDAHDVCLAYALYRLGKLDELRELATKCKHIGVKMALAQAEYRFGLTTKSLALMKECKPYLSGQDSEDMETNIYAVKSLYGVRVHRPPRSFDDWFNLGCCYISRGKFEQSLDALKHALKYAESEEDAEHTRAQMAVVYTLLGDHEEAKQQYEQINMLEDIVIAHNKRALETKSGLEQVHLDLKIYDDLSRAKLDLNSSQRQILERQQLKLKAKAGLNVIRQARKFSKEFEHDLEPLCVAYHYQLSTKEIAKLAAGGDKAAQLVIRARNTPRIDTDKYSKFVGSVVENGDYKFGQLLAHINHPEFEQFLDYIKDDKVKTAGMCVIGKGPQMESLLPESRRYVNGLQSDDILAKLSKEPPVQKKRKRHVVSDGKADPERWIAKQDRKDAKGGATQGSTTSKPVKENHGGKVSGPKKRRK